MTFEEWLEKLGYGLYEYEEFLREAYNAAVEEGIRREKDKDYEC